MIAIQYLEKEGHSLLRHNYHVRFAEIDLITLCPNQIFHFVEVKFWKNNILHPLESITNKKIRRQKRAALYFISELHTLKKNFPASDEISVALPPSESPDDIMMSFDLVWVHSEEEIEYHRAIF